MKLKLNIKLIEKHRKDNKLTKLKLSKKFGYSHSSGYSNLIQTGCIPRNNILDKIAKELNCHKNKLIVIK